MSARRELVAAVAERYRAAERCEKGRILDELTAVTGWHRKHAVRALRAKQDGQIERDARVGSTARAFVMPSSPCERLPIACVASGSR
jgi:hypothetical protein